MENKTCTLCNGIGQIMVEHIINVHSPYCDCDSACTTCPVQDVIVEPDVCPTCGGTGILANEE